MQHRCEKATGKFLLSMLKNTFGGHFTLTFPWLVLLFLIPPSLVITTSAMAAALNPVRGREEAALKL